MNQMNIFERILSIVAALITLLNFAYSVLNSPTFGISYSMPVFPIDSYLLRIIIFFVLECTISAFFWYVFLSACYHFPFPLVVITGFLVAVFSPWTSIFNIEWILLISTWKICTKVIVIILGSIVANVVFIVFGFGIESDRADIKEEPISVIGLFHLLPFIIVGGILLFERVF